MEQLIFYHPEVMDESPAKVAANVWHHLYKNMDRLDMDLRLVTRNRAISRRYKDVLVSDPDLKKVGKDAVFYFPISPSISLKRNTSLLFKLKRKHATIISDYHGDFREDMYNHLKNREIGMFLYSIPSATLAPIVLNWHEEIILHSRYLKKILRSRYNIRSRITVVPNGVDRRVLKERYDPVDLDGGFNIFFHGRHSHEKGLDILLDAIGSLPKGRREEARVHIAGKGPLTSQLKRRAVELGIKDNVDFIGFPPLDEIFSYMRSVDMMIYPSRYDNFPVAVLEALAVADCPVFFSDKMGLADYAGTELGAHVFPLSKVSIRDLITKMMAGDIEARTEVKNQRRFARKFTWDKVIHDYIRFFNKLD